MILDGKQSIAIPVAVGVFFGGLALFFFLSFWPAVLGVSVVGLIVAAFAKSRTARWTLIAIASGAALTGAAIWGVGQAVGWATTSDFAQLHIGRTARFEAMNPLVFRAIPFVLIALGWLAFTGACALAERDRWASAISTFLVGLIVIGGSGGAYALYGAAQGKTKADKSRVVAECRMPRVRSVEEQKKCDQTLALEAFLDDRRDYWTELLKEDPEKAEQLLRQMDKDLTNNGR